MFPEDNDQEIPQVINDEESAAEKLQKELDAFMSRPTFVSGMKKAASAIRIDDEMSWGHDIITNWPVYAFLGISSVFTAMLGFYMGTAPKIQADGSLYFQMDAIHIITAIIYSVAFVAITEFPFALSSHKYYTREHGNQAQGISMIIMMGVSAFSILGTGIAGGVVIASTINFLSEFVTIPSWAQEWVVRILPILFMVYAVLLKFYSLKSNQAESARMLRGIQHQRELDGRARAQATRQMMDEQLSLAQNARYVEMVRKGLMTTAQARAAIDAESTLMLPPPPKQQAQRPALQRPQAAPIDSLFNVPAKNAQYNQDVPGPADTGPNPQGRL